MAKRTPNSDLKVGDTVVIEFAGREIQAVIIEDRGPIGVGGRRLYRVKWPVDSADDPMEIELPAEELRRAG